MRFSEEILISIFEETFNDKIQRIYNKSFSTFFVGRKYSMEYNFLEGQIFLYKWPKIIGVIFISERDIFSENASNDYIYDIGLFEYKLKKFIESNQKKSRRKFLSK